MVAPDCNPRTWELETGILIVEINLWFKASVGSIQPYFKINLLKSKPVNKLSKFPQCWSYRQRFLNICFIFSMPVGHVLVCFLMSFTSLVVEMGGYIQFSFYYSRLELTALFLKISTILYNLSF